MSSRTLDVDKVRVTVERRLGRVEQRLGLVADLGQLTPQLVGELELVGVVDQAVDLLLREPARRLHAHRLRLAGAEVLGLDAHDAVGVDAERDLDLRDAARRRRDAGELEAREAPVVGGHLALALEHVDGDERLIVHARREDLALLGRDRRVARDERREDAAARLDADRERRHVEEQHLDLVVAQRGALQGGAGRDDLVRVHALVRFLSEELLHRSSGRRASGSSRRRGSRCGCP